ncbi:hypothetical protein BOTBODRAFT_179004 [Botryobasidium botryosum FD-172 SS1]|uniref:FAM86 N-terminal domain-containing protein n=1 Tax=Botryobasidium botryosum (strain FD-172 SS1) TaxID=930990 RepID=A0A067M125_BOTB1|nr:hypothetical protein BOTBODRAFT_179004 [Botryobasidium botryosum FD-172 SS1]
MDETPNLTIWRTWMKCFTALSPPSAFPPFPPSSAGLQGLQTFLIEQIICNHHFKAYPPSPSYQLKFWKWIIGELEARDEEVRDNIYGLFMSRLNPQSTLATNLAVASPSLPPSLSYTAHFYAIPPSSHSDKDNRRNTISSERTITLLESRTMIEGGTTGLRTWKANYVFAEWLLAHPEIVRSKRVLELGSGVGFLGILIAGIQQSALGDNDGTLSSGSDMREGVPSLCLTGVNTSVLARCHENIRHSCSKLKNSTCIPEALLLNNPYPQMCPRFLAKKDGVASHPSLHIRSLDWTDAIEDHVDSTRRDALLGFFHEIDPDVILGADLVYDSTILPELIAVLRMLLIHPYQNYDAKLASGKTVPGVKERECRLAVSVRQEATFAEFLKRADIRSVKLEYGIKCTTDPLRQLEEPTAVCHRVAYLAIDRKLDLNPTVTTEGALQLVPNSSVECLSFSWPFGIEGPTHHKDRRSHIEGFAARACRPFDSSR